MLNAGFDAPQIRRPDRLGRRLRILLYVAGLEPGGPKSGSNASRALSIEVALNASSHGDGLGGPSETA